MPALGALFWLVDPLDGTREFVSRNGEFTVNLALIEQGAPVLGVVSAPVPSRLYSGVAGLGAWVDDAGAPSHQHPPGAAEGLTVLAEPIPWRRRGAQRPR